MNLARFSIEKSRITVMVLATILVMGLVTYGGLARDSMPPYTVRVATVVSSFPGASPERVEQLVTDRVEKIAQELPELKEVTSTSRTGLSIVSVTLKDEVGPNQLQSVFINFQLFKSIFPKFNLRKSTNDKLVMIDRHNIVRNHLVTAFVKHRCRSRLPCSLVA